MSEDDDLLAGEYVLGSLTQGEREAANARRLVDASFDAAIREWERLIGPASEAVPSSPVPPALWPAIQAGIRAGRPERVVPLRGTEISLRRWKATARAAMAVAALLALWIAGTALRDRTRTGATLVAVLDPVDHPASFLVLADLGSHEMSVNAVAAQPPPGKSFELWVVDPSLPAPRSLGVLGADGTRRTAMPGLDPALLTRATYAVTVEPAGGSPTGRPSGAPLYTGHLLRPGPPSP